jgi:hypothetical protein
MNDSSDSSKNIKFNLEEIKWSIIRDEVYKVNAELAEKCDNFKHKDYSVFKISYPYGVSIVNNGEFCLPTIEGKIIPINDDRVPEYLKKNLTYAHIPLSIITHNSSEVFIKIQDRVISLNFLVPGDLFGLFELMNLLHRTSTTDVPVWNVSAGVRSTFMIPSISNTNDHNKIKKKLGVDINMPLDLSDHWKTFVDINKYSSNKNCWYNTIIVFSNEWFQDQENEAYINFYKYLVRQCWKQFQLLEDFTEFSSLWSLFSHAINKRNLKPRPYLIDTIKHLILIAKGGGIGFKPALNDIALPKNLIQQVYLDDYGLKDYIPNIMQPTKFTKTEKVYYSLSFPTLLDSSPYFKNPPSIIEDQREIKKLLDILIHTINQIENQTINPLKNIQFELFHSSTDPFGQILPSKNIAEYDSRFLEYHSNDKEQRSFCSSSSFFNGCIAISNIK